MAKLSNSGPRSQHSRSLPHYLTGIQMESIALLDLLPLWGLFATTIALVFISIECGYRLGRYRRSHSDQEKEAPVGAIVGATLGLLAFMLAFTFGLAAARFEKRRQLVLDESNAIGTTYLRADFLPEPHSTRIRKLLQQYTTVRLEGALSDNTEESIATSSELHRDLWSEATELMSKDDHSIANALFVHSLNQVIDINAERLSFALRNRLPVSVWLALFALAALAMIALGYQEGLAGSRRTLAVLSLALAFSSVLLLIADLDRPQEGLLRVSQRAMIELRDSVMNGDRK